MKNILKKSLLLLGLLILSLGLLSCGDDGYKYDYSEESADADYIEEVDDAPFTSGQYILVYNDEEASEVRLYNTTSKVNESYDYTSSTYVLDSYGDIRTWSYLEVGDPVCIAIKESGDGLSAIQKSSEAWSKEEVDEFEINYVDDDLKYMTINSVNYRIVNDVIVFCGGEQIAFEELSDMDVINVYGYDKKINSIVVEKQHGTLTLEGTNTYVGGWICVGGVYSGEITEDMSVEIAAGTYMLSAAKDGKGGSTRIKIRSGKETVFDLGDLGASFDKIGSIRFHIYPEDTEFTINGKEYDYTNAIKLRYGVYKLYLYSEEYGAISRTLIVSSENATIVFDMEELTGADEEEDTTVTTEDSDEDSDSEDTDEDSDEDTEEVTSEEETDEE
ncbi:MAG: hypothetical protein K6G40_00595 [Eubacterium sp.]|nr:hypothetical protein [Eubacterium sp.]